MNRQQLIDGLKSLGMDLNNVSDDIPDDFLAEVMRFAQQWAADMAAPNSSNTKPLTPSAKAGLLAKTDLGRAVLRRQGNLKTVGDREASDGAHPGAAAFSERRRKTSMSPSRKAALLGCTEAGRRALAAQGKFAKFSESKTMSESKRRKLLQMTEAGRKALAREAK